MSAAIQLFLHKKQGIALGSQATEILFGGGAGGGKSHLLRAAAILWCSEIAGLQAYLFRRTYPDLNKNHMEGPSSFPILLAPWLENHFVKINHSKGVIEFVNGSRIHLCHCQYEKDVYDYQGAEIHLLLFDELTQFTKSIYAFLRSRVRIAGVTIPDKYRGRFPRMLAGANPGGIGHGWVKHDFIDLAPPYAITRVGREEGGMLRQFVPSLLEDNPTILEQDPDYEIRLEGLGNAALVKAMRWGDWNIVAGGALDDLWQERIHVLPPFPIPEGWRIDRSFDWGSSRPFAVGWWAESNGTIAGNGRHYPPGTLFRIQEWYGSSGKPNEGCRMLAREIAAGILEREKRWGLTMRVLPGPADSAIYDVDNGLSIAEEMRQWGVEWQRAEKGPGSRKLGLLKIRDRLKAALSYPMETPGLFVFDSCRHFIRTLPVLPRSESDPDDIDTQAEDHIYDETRYRCLYIPRIPRSEKFWK